MELLPIATLQGVISGMAPKGTRGDGRKGVELKPN